MIVVLSTLVGLLPHIFKYFQEKSDKKQELEIMKLQFSMQQQGLKTQLQEISTITQGNEINTMYNNIKTNIRFIDGLNGIVRPTIALIYTAKIIVAMIFWENMYL